MKDYNNKSIGRCNKSIFSVRLKYREKDNYKR